MKYIFRGMDFKANSWKEASEDKDIILIDGSRIIFTFSFIKSTIFRKQQNFTLIIRYLNDYNSFVKSILLFLSEFLLFTYVKLKGINLYWICHNIDRESQDFYPTLTKIRRIWVISTAKKIFVMDKYLTKYAKLLFRRYSNKIYSTNFGKYENELVIHQSNEVNRLIDNENYFFKGIKEEELLEIVTKRSSKFDYLGFCSGKVIKKKIHFEKIIELIEAGKANDINILVLVISDLQESKDPKLYNSLKKSNNVIFVNNLMKINAFKLSKLIDFYWLGYTDISIPYSIYVASSVNTPVLALNKGVLPIIISNYQIGEILRDDYDNLKSVLRTIKNNNYNFKSFLANHNWKNGIEKITIKN